MRIRIIETVFGLSPILCRPGGKKLLKKRIIKQIPPHKTYVEPFMGTGAVFFDKPLVERNILGDNDQKLMRFYKEAKKRNGLTCDLRRNESKWDRLKSKRDKSPCDYVYVTKASFGCIGERFNNLGRGGSNSIQNYDRQVKKLKSAKLVQGDYRKLIRQHDSKDTFFYLDPPYHETSCSYPEGSCAVTPQDVLKSVRGMKGKFILSYNNHPEVRELFCNKYKCSVVQTRYTNNKLIHAHKQQRKELIIKNF